MRATRLVAALLLFAAAPTVRAQAQAEPSGIAAFTRHEQFVDAQVSPKGTYLAAISMEGGKRTLIIVDSAARKIISALKPERDAMVGDFSWANDEVVVAEIWTQEGSVATPQSTGELAAVKAKSGNAKFIFGYRAGETQTGSHIRQGERDLASARVVDTLRNDDRNILIAVRSWNATGDRVVELYKLDTITGVKNKVGASPIPEADFQTDENGEVRLAYGLTLDWKLKIFYREPGEAWQDVTGLKAITDRAEPLAFVAKDRTMYLVEPESKGFRIDAVNVDTGARKQISRNEMVPPAHLYWDRETRRVIAVEYEPDLPIYDFPDPDHPLSRALKGLLAAFPDDHVRLLSLTDDAKKAVVLLYSDRNPGKLLLLDVARLSAEPLFETRPWIRPERMAEMTAFHIRASDGLMIHGYVTLPPRHTGSAPPLVVLPHGGPHYVRDHWTFNPEVQLLASQGFAVLQVNYRGSGGYGRLYGEAGYRKWGGRVIEDILDATRWVIQKGHADPKRICIYGASFGAYAAMQASILAPDLFRCAVGYAGIYDLGMLETGGHTAFSGRARGYVRRVVGTEEEALRAASPAHNAAMLKPRVLIIHGTEDKRAPIAHAEALKAALSEVGHPPEWLVESGEGHGFYDEAKRERMYTRLIAFLKENTQPAPPGKAIAAPPPVQR